MNNTNVTNEMYNKNKFDMFYEKPITTKFHICRINPENGVSQFFNVLKCEWADGYTQLMPWTMIDYTLVHLFNLLEKQEPDYIITLVCVEG